MHVTPEGTSPTRGNHDPAACRVTEFRRSSVRNSCPPDHLGGHRHPDHRLDLLLAVCAALLPYIALQLVGIQAVLTVMGVGTSSTNTFVKDLTLFIAFLVLAIFTYVSGLRAPALIAFIKDTLVYLMIIVAVLYIPTRVGGWGHIFAAGAVHMKAINPATHKPNGVFGSCRPSRRWSAACSPDGSTATPCSRAGWPA